MSPEDDDDNEVKPDFGFTRARLVKLNSIFLKQYFNVNISKFQLTRREVKAICLDLQLGFYSRYKGVHF